MNENAEIIAMRISTHKDLLKIVDEVKKGNVIIASLSAFKSVKIRRDIVRRILEAKNRLNFNVLGVGSEYVIIAPSSIKIRVKEN